MAGPTGIEPVTPGLKVRTFSPEKSFTKRGRVDWMEARSRFIDYVKVEEYDEDTRDDFISYLDKYKPVLDGPQDVIALLANVKSAKRHVVFGLRVLLNFYEVMGYPKEYLNVLRGALPNLQSGVDLRIPAENKILLSLGKLPTIPLKYQALYSLLLDSGLRLAEAVEVINNFTEAECVNGFYRCEVAMFRGEKQAYYAHFSEQTLDLVKQVKEKLVRNSSSSYFRHHSMTAPKYLRKFDFDKMIELDIPESVADFIEGRVPKTVGAKHYLALARQAAKFYPRYAEYLKGLRKA